MSPSFAYSQYAERSPGPSPELVQKGPAPAAPSGPSAFGNPRPVAPATKPNTLSLDLEKAAENKGVSPNTPSEGSVSGSSLTHMKSIRRFGRAGSIATTVETKILVAWLESYEDHTHFPASESPLVQTQLHYNNSSYIITFYFSDDLLQHTSTGLEPTATSSSSLNRQQEPPVYIIFIHPLRNGLYRIKMEGQAGK